MLTLLCRFEIAFLLTIFFPSGVKVFSNRVDISHSCYVSLNHVHYNVSFTIPADLLTVNHTMPNSATQHLERLKMLLKKQQAKFPNSPGYNQSFPMSTVSSELLNSRTQLKPFNTDGATQGYIQSRNPSKSSNFDMIAGYNQSRIPILEKRFRAILLYHQFLGSGRFVEGDFCDTSFTLPARGVVDCGLFHVADSNLYEIRLRVVDKEKNETVIDQMIDSMKPNPRAFKCFKYHGPSEFYILEAFSSLIEVSWSYPAYELLYLASYHNLTIYKDNNTMILQKKCRNPCPPRTSTCHCQIAKSKIIEACTNYTICLNTIYKFHDQGEYCEQFWVKHPEGDENCTQKLTNQSKIDNMETVLLILLLVTVSFVFAFVGIFRNKCKTTVVAGQSNKELTKQVADTISPRINAEEHFYECIEDLYNHVGEVT